MGVESEYLSDIYSDWDSDYTSESIARKEYDRLETLAVLSGLKVYEPEELEGKFVIVQNSKKDKGKLLLLVDRSKCKDHWWTYNLSIAYTGPKDEMKSIASKLKYNNVRVISLSNYLF